MPPLSAVHCQCPASVAEGVDTCPTCAEEVHLSEGLLGAVLSADASHPDGRELAGAQCVLPWMDVC
jgi:hypothetical protein